MVEKHFLNKSPKKYFENKKNTENMKILFIALPCLKTDKRFLKANFVPKLIGGIFLFVKKEFISLNNSFNSVESKLVKSVTSSKPNDIKGSLSVWSCEDVNKESKAEICVIFFMFFV